MGKKGSMASEQHGSKIKLFCLQLQKHLGRRRRRRRRTNFLYDERQWRMRRRARSGAGAGGVGDGVVRLWLQEWTTGWLVVVSWRQGGRERRRDRPSSGTVDRNRPLHSRGLVPLQVAGASALNKIRWAAARQRPSKLQCNVCTKFYLNLFGSLLRRGTE